MKKLSLLLFIVIILLFGAYLYIYLTKKLPQSAPGGASYNYITSSENSKYKLELARKESFDKLLKSLGLTFKRNTEGTGNLKEIEFAIVNNVQKDSQVKKLLSSRKDIFLNYNQENFEHEFKNFFTLLYKNKVKNSLRTIYLYKTK